MKDMLFSNYFMVVYLFILMFFCVVDIFFTPLIKSDKDEQKNNDKNIKSGKSFKTREIVQAIVMFSVLIFGIYLVIKYNILPVIYVFIIIGILQWVIILPYIIWNFIQYIFVKPFDYELTETRKNTLRLLGIIMYFVCGVVTRKDTGDQINRILFNVEPVIADFSMIALMTFWYFVVIFFALSLFVLSLHKINIVVRSRMSVKLIISNSNPKEEEERKFTFLANHIVGKIEVLPKGKVWKQISYHIIWFICLPVDAVIGFLKVVIDFVRKLITIMIFMPPRLFRNSIRYLSNALSKNQGKAIIIISRVSLVSSLIIVYLIDKYQHVFSVSGSEIYEFMCSVIIIPLVITQLIELKNNNMI